MKKFIALMALIALAGCDNTPNALKNKKVENSITLEDAMYSASAYIVLGEVEKDLHKCYIVHPDNIQYGKGYVKVLAGEEVMIFSSFSIYVVGKKLSRFQNYLIENMDCEDFT